MAKTVVQICNFFDLCSAKLKSNIGAIRIENNVGVEAVIHDDIEKWNTLLVLH